MYSLSCFTSSRSIGNSINASNFSDIWRSKNFYKQEINQHLIQTNLPRHEVAGAWPSLAALFLQELLEFGKVERFRDAAARAVLHGIGAASRSYDLEAYAAKFTNDLDFVHLKRADDGGRSARASEPIPMFAARADAPIGRRGVMTPGRAATLLSLQRFERPITLTRPPTTNIIQRLSLCRLLTPAEPTNPRGGFAASKLGNGLCYVSASLAATESDHKGQTSLATATAICNRSAARTRRPRLWS